jgi:hypothetical protein
MNDLELQARLKSAPVPARPAEYWEEFPWRVRVQLERRQPAPRRSRSWRQRLGWAADLGFSAALILICLQCRPWQPAAAAITQRERCLHVEFARLDAGLHQLMLNTDGLGYLLNDSN